MRAASVLAILLVVPVFLPGLSGAQGAETGGGAARGRAPAELPGKLLDIAFDKSEYVIQNFSGNMTMNLTFTSNSGSEENVSLMSSFRTITESYELHLQSNLSWPRYVVLAPYGTQTIQVKVSISKLSSISNGYFVKATYEVTAYNNHIYGYNSTTIISYGRYSIKIIEPVVVSNNYHVLVGASLVVRLNVTNYSDIAIDGTLRGYQSSKHVFLGPGSSMVLSFKIGPFHEVTSKNIVFSLSADSSYTQIGFDMIGGKPANIADSAFSLHIQKLIDIGVGHYRLELAQPGTVDIYVLSGSSSTIRNIRFTVEILGWLSERMSHPGEFTIADLKPWNKTRVSYNITPHVAGTFSLKVSTAQNGGLFCSLNGELAVFTSTAPSLYSPESIEGDRHMGDREFINGTFTNNYPYALHNVKLLVMLEHDFHGLLSKEQFLGFSPAEMSFAGIESNQTVDFAFNVTLSSPGSWKLAVVALWEGNASCGGSGILHELHVHRTRFAYSPIGIVMAVAIVASAPKAIDIVIRRRRGIAP